MTEDKAVLEIEVALFIEIEREKDRSLMVDLKPSEFDERTNSTSNFLSSESIESFRRQDVNNLGYDRFAGYKLGRSLLCTCNQG